MTGVQGCAEPTAPSGCWATYPAGRPSGAPREGAIGAAPPGPEAGRKMDGLSQKQPPADTTRRRQRRPPEGGGGGGTGRKGTRLTEGGQELGEKPRPGARDVWVCLSQGDLLCVLQTWSVTGVTRPSCCVNH